MSDVTVTKFYVFSASQYVNLQGLHLVKEKQTNKKTHNRKDAKCFLILERKNTYSW